MASSSAFDLHLAVPNRFWLRVKQFYPKESPLVNMINGFPGILISITPSIIMKKEIASSLALNIISF